MADGGEAWLQVEQCGDGDSEPRPRAFIWKGTRWEINSVGRTWTAKGEVHYLVMAQGDRVFELAYSAEVGSWRLVRQPEDFGPKRRAA